MANVLQKLGIKTPRSMLVVLLEGRRMAWTMCRYAKGEWRTGDIESQTVPEGDTAVDVLKRKTFKVPKSGSTHLAIVVSPAYYHYHKESYPKSLAGKAEEVLQYDAAENVALADAPVYFHGPLARLDSHLHVPSFAMPGELHQAILQAARAEEYAGVQVIPSCMLLADGEAVSDSTSHYCIRPTGDGGVELHRLHAGLVMESLEAGPGSRAIEAWMQRLRLAGEWGGEDTRVTVLGDSRELGNDIQNALAGRDHEIKVSEDAVFSRYLRNLLGLHVQQGFEGRVRIRPRKPPKAAWAALVIFILYAVFCYVRLDENRELVAASQARQAQIEELKEQWRPLEAGMAVLEKSKGLEAGLKAYEREAFSMLTFMEYLTAITPDGTWINQLRFRGGTLILSGQSDAALEYQNTLIDSDLITSAEFDSDIRRRPDTGKEAFVIRADIDPAALGAASLAALAAIRSAGQEDAGREGP